MSNTKPAKAKAQKAAPAEAEKLAPAKDFAASGAVIEPAIVDRVDMNHPAVDNNPRERSTADMNRIEFNDPTITQEEAVAKNLRDQAKD